MTKASVVQLLIGLILLGGGTMVFLHPGAVFTFLVRIAELKEESAFLSRSQRVWSIRATGVGLMMVGLFLIWMYWRYR